MARIPEAEIERLKREISLECRRRLNFDQSCRLNFDQGRKPPVVNHGCGCCRAIRSDHAAQIALTTPLQLILPIKPSR